ncbi:MAG: hypothetical protein NUV82_04065 [Candidatus Komeilibacteria bacterium]|nr:hypothetical protein [Candidatus Komeilibacteria bacterium]
MKYRSWAVIALLVAVSLAVISHEFFVSTTLTFLATAAALILISKFLGDATEALSHYMGDKTAGIINVTLSNLAELIIIYVAVSKNMINLVQAGIVGSIVGNLLLVMGTSILFGAWKNGEVKLHAGSVTLYINQLMVVAIILFMPTMFNDGISKVAHVDMSYIFAGILVSTYFIYYLLSRKDKRVKPIDEGLAEVGPTWSKSKAVTILVLMAIGAFFMSEYLIETVEPIAHQWSLSDAFIGFILLPMFGNLAEHSVAVTAAYKNKGELSMAVCVGSASQVGMVVAPAAVIFGLFTGNTVTLDFVGLPLHVLAIAVISTFLVLRDNKWNLAEGIALLVIYLAMTIGFAFTI